MRWLVLFIGLLAGFSPGQAQAASASENRAFNAAWRGFSAGSYEWAEKEFGDFIKKYPAADRWEEAWLAQAQSRYQLKRFTGVVELLSITPVRPLRQADQMLFWRAEAYFALTNHSAAATEFARLLAQHPNSPRQLEASLGEAAARQKMGELSRVVDLLRRPEGAFQRSARAQPEKPASLRGNLMLGEVLLGLGSYPEAEEILSALAKRNAPTELRWQNLYLLSRAQLAADKSPLADQTASNLLPLAVASGDPSLLAHSHALRGEISEKLSRFDLALQSYTNNLVATAPESSRRQALLQIVRLNLVQNQTTNALVWLDRLARDNPRDASMDYIQFTLGELRLKEYYAVVGEPALGEPPLLRAAPTNMLGQAVTHFDRIVTEFPQSALVGKSWLNLGWCLWNQGQMAGGQAAFKKATELLPPSEEQAQARFKWADVQYQLKDFSGAISNYSRLLADPAPLPKLKPALLEQTQYQIVRAGIDQGDAAGLNAAQWALNKMLSEAPASRYADRSLLLVGQALGDLQRTNEARALLAELPQRYPESPLLPAAQLAVARTYALAQDYPAALEKFDAWIGRYAEHAARPQVEFDRAWLNYQAGNPTNALSLFTNLIVRFPTNTLAPVAQKWVADYYFRLGDFITAEKNYQSLFQNTNWPPSELSFRAQLDAARAANARQGYTDAKRYLLNLVNDPGCPPALVAETLFVYGDNLTEEAVADPKNPLDNYAEAIKSFGRITQTYPPTNPMVARAYGRIADCHLQLAVQDVTRYKLAIDFYKQAMESPSADAATRGLAEVGWGKALEKQAQQRPAPEQKPLLDEALKHYQNVVFRSQPTDRERPDGVSIREAGLAAGRLLEAQQRWTEAHKFYRALLDILPALKATWEKKISQTKDRVDASP